MPTKYFLKGGLYGGLNGWFHGDDRGKLYFEHDVWDLTDAHTRQRVRTLADQVVEVRDGDEVGYGIIVRSCSAPLDQIAENAGQDGGVVVSKVAEGKGNFGYDALNDSYVDMVKSGIIDPTKVTRSALQNAASVSTLLLTSDALIADMPKDEKPAGGGGHGGYDDMY